MYIYTYVTYVYIHDPRRAYVCLFPWAQKRLRPVIQAAGLHMYGCMISSNLDEKLWIQINLPLKYSTWRCSASFNFFCCLLEVHDVWKFLCFRLKTIRCYLLNWFKLLDFMTFQLPPAQMFLLFFVAFCSRSSLLIFMVSLSENPCLFVFSVLTCFVFRTVLCSSLPARFDFFQIYGLQPRTTSS